VTFHHACVRDDKFAGLLETDSVDVLQAVNEFRALAKKHGVKLYGVPFRSTEFKKPHRRTRRLMDLMRV